MCVCVFQDICVKIQLSSEISEMFHSLNLCKHLPSINRCVCECLRVCVCARAVIGFDLLSVYFPHSADHMNRFIVHTESPLCCVVIRSLSPSPCLS